jgi:transposase-like protein
MDLARLKKKFQTFDKNLPTEEICRKKFYRWRWPNGFKCPECGASGKSARYLFSRVDRGGKRARTAHNDLAVYTPNPNGYFPESSIGSPKDTCNDPGSRKKRILYQCKECGRQTSLTAGTIFHRTRVQLGTWLLMIYLMMLKPDNMRMDETRKTLGLTSRTFWRMKKIIERAMKQDRLVRKIMDIMDPKGKYHQ